MLIKIHYLFLACAAAIPLTQAYTADDSIAKLGFDLHLSPLPVDQVDAKTPVISALGFPDPIAMYRGKFDTPTTFTVTFGFQSNVMRASILNPCATVSQIGSINLGQELDAQTLLYAIIECFKKGYKQIHIFANSRGAGATLSMLDMLSNPLQHNHTWRRLGITDFNTQQAVRAMVARGTLFLTHPLLDQDQAVQTIARSIARTVWPLPGSDLLKSSMICSAHTMLHTFTAYDADYPTPYTILEHNISHTTWPYNITIALAKKDRIVGHAHDLQLSALADAYPDKLHVIEGGAGHCDIKQVIKNFRESLFRESLCECPSAENIYPQACGTSTS